MITRIDLWGIGLLVVTPLLNLLTNYLSRKEAPAGAVTQSEKKNVIINSYFNMDKA